MRIPSGEGMGNRVAQAPSLSQSVTTAPFGEPVAQGMASLGGSMMRDEARQAHEAKVEAQRQSDIRVAADKANALAGMQTAQEDLAALHDDFTEKIKTGQIDKTKAAEEWGTQSRERITASMEGVAPAYAQIVQRDLDGRALRLGRGVAKAVSLRDQQDVRSGIDQVLEATQREFMTNPAAAQSRAMDTLQQLGPFGGLDPAEIAKVGQSWKERTRFTRGTMLVNDARRDNGALGKVEALLAGPEFADMDPQRKVQLNAQIEGFRVSNIQRAESAQRQAQARQDHALRVAEAEFNAASTLITSGKVLSPEYVERLTARTAGTPFAAALPELVKQAADRSAFGMQPIAAMDQAISTARAQLNTQGTDPQTEKRIDSLEKIRDAKRQAYADDPLLASQEYGGPAVAPIDTSSIQTILSGLSARTEAVAYASQDAGHPVSPLLKSEAETLGKMINVLPVEQRSSAVAGLAQALGPQEAAALGRQMAPKDKPLSLALGLAGAKTSEGRYTSELVLRGAQAIKDRSVKEDNTALTGVRALVAEEIGGAYPNEALRQSMIDAATYAEYGLRSEGDGDVDKAVRLVTGGIIERGGKKVPLPYGMSEEDFDKKLKAITPITLHTATVYIGGHPVSAYDFLAKLPQAALIHAGQGRYAVQTGGGVATDEKGRPVILEVK